MYYRKNLNKIFLGKFSSVFFLFSKLKDTISSIAFFKVSLRENCPYLDLFWSVFSRIWTEYGEILIPNGRKYGPEYGPKTDHWDIGFLLHETVVALTD